MPETMSPREKVEKIVERAVLRSCNRTISVKGVSRKSLICGEEIDTATDAILAALASSGDHAELARAIDRLLPITIQNTPDYAEVSFGECQAQAMTMEPETWLALNQLPALIAEVAALRGERDEAAQVIEAEREDRELIEGRLTDRATEAERKLAEAAEWRPIETFTGSGQNESVMVAVPNGEGGFIVGEAWRCVMADDDDYRGLSGWWWAGTSPGDYNHDPIRDMNHGDPMFWLPLPPAPGAEDE